jgi:hypothetical protein
MAIREVNAPVYVLARITSPFFEFVGEPGYSPLTSTPAARPFIQM